MCYRTQKRSRHLLAFIFATVSTVYQIDAFQAAPAPVVSRANHVLFTSLSTPSGHLVTNDDDGPDEDDSDSPWRRLSNKEEVNIQVIAMGNNTKRDEFQRHLKRIFAKVRNKKKRAHLMYDALKRAEIAYYDLAEESMPELYSQETDHPYDGPIIRPESRCYAMVINAYANAKLGEQGGKTAEEILQRHNDFWGSEANHFLHKGVMKTWLQAGDMRKAKEHLNRIEDIYRCSSTDLGDYDLSVYTKFMDRLPRAGDKYRKDMGNWSTEVLESAREQFLGDGLALMPSFRDIYVSTMECQRRSYRGIISLRRAHSVFEQLEADYSSFNEHFALKPSAECAVPIAQAVTHCHGRVESIEILEKVLARLEGRFDRTGDKDFLPSEQMYALLLSSYGRVSADQSSKYSSKVEGIMSRMSKYGIQPSKYALTAALMAKANDKSDESLQVAESLIATMEEPDAVAYQCLIKAFCRNGNAKAAENYLDKLASQFGADVMSMGSCLDAWSKSVESNSEEAIARAQDLLDKIIHRYEMGLVGPFEKHVNSWVFEDVARMWARTRSPDAGDQIVSLIRRMEELHKVAPGLFHPSDTLYMLAMDAYSSSATGGPCNKAAQLLGEMDSLAEKKLLAEPNNRVLSSTLVAMTRSTGPGAANMTHEIFQRIVSRFEEGDRSCRIHPRTFTALFFTLFRSHERFSTEKALGVLQETIDACQRYPADLTLNSFGFNAFLDGLFRRQAFEEAWQIFEQMKNLETKGFKTRPDSVTYSCMAKVVAKSKSANALTRLNSLVDEIVFEQKEGRLDPDIRLVNTILSEYSRLATFHPEAANESAGFLTITEGLAEQGAISKGPTTSSYRSVCLALARSKASNVSKTILEIFERARRKSSDFDQIPIDRDFYFAVISALARDEANDGIEKAMAILDEMEMNRDNENRDGVPDTRVYNYILSAIASSQDPEKVPNAVSLLERMCDSPQIEDSIALPDIQTYNWVILAASRSHSTCPETIRQNFDIALEKFKLVHKSESNVEPNSLTYEFFLKSCVNLLPAGKVQSNLIEKAFLLCRQKSLVTPQIFKLARCYVEGIDGSLETLRTSSFSKVGEKHTDMLLPSAWCNLVPEKYRKRKIEVSGRDDLLH